MKSFLLGAEREGAFNIPFKVEIGESMKTIVCQTRCATIEDVVAWLTSLGYSYTDNLVFVHKDHKYNLQS